MPVSGGQGSKSWLYMELTAATASRRTTAGSRSIAPNRRWHHAPHRVHGRTTPPRLEPTQDCRPVATAWDLELVPTRVVEAGGHEHRAKARGLPTPNSLGQSRDDRNLDRQTHAGAPHSLDERVSGTRSVPICGAGPHVNTQSRGDWRQKAGPPAGSGCPSCGQRPTKEGVHRRCPGIARTCR